jgi:uncharacterized protein
LAAPTHAATPPIPAFTPNVVDTTNTLTPSDISDINTTLQLARDKADIWGAVYIVNSLQGEPIESLAERAFRAWALGRKGQDNGLLLVLAMQDRQSRFEVGYGLEGDLPDLLTKRALDDVLAPFMRQGKVKTGIAQSFNYLAGMKSRDPVFALQAAPEQPKTAPTHLKSANVDDGSRNGWLAYGLYLVFLWGMPLVLWFSQLSRARRLAAVEPRYWVEDDVSLNRGRFAFWNAYGFVVIFMMVNPGLFVYLIASMLPLALGTGLTLVLCVLTSRLLARSGVSRYASLETYHDWKKAERLRAISRSSSGSGSSGSSSSHSSSSGGGRSGGGGSSRSW